MLKRVESGPLLCARLTFKLYVMTREPLLDLLHGSVVVFLSFALTEYAHVLGDEGADAVTLHAGELAVAPVYDTRTTTLAGWRSCGPFVENV